MTLPLSLTRAGLYWERLVDSETKLIISLLFFFQLTIAPTETEYFVAQALIDIPLSKSCNALAFSTNVFLVYFFFPLMVRVSLLFEQHLNVLQLLYDKIRMNYEMTVILTEWLTQVFNVMRTILVERSGIYVQCSKLWGSFW
jgi:hypothetical protein